MDRNTDPRYSTSFRVKKWILFTFCSMGIVGSILIPAVAGSIIDEYVDNNYNQKDSGYTEDNKQDIKDRAKLFMYTVALFSILFNLLGLMGAYKEHYCMTISFAILITLVVFCSLNTAIDAPAYWSSVVVNFIVCSLAYAFACDLRRRRQLAFAQPVVYLMASTQPQQHVFAQIKQEYA